MNWIGLEPERLTLAQRLELKGAWIALPLYDPKTLPLRRIAAFGTNVEACVRDAIARGLDPAAHEYVRFEG
jgi:hypothetical protein